MRVTIRPWLKGVFLLSLILGWPRWLGLRYLRAGSTSTVSRPASGPGATSSLGLHPGHGLAVVTSLIPSLPLDVLAGAVFGPGWGPLRPGRCRESGRCWPFLSPRGLGREAIVRLLKKDIASATPVPSVILP